MEIDLIIRTKRKSIALIVKRDGSLVVRAPFQSSDEQILAVVERKIDWIKTKKQFVEDHYPKVAPKEYINGEGFLYLGNSYRLEIVDCQNDPLVLKDRFYLERSFLENAEATFRTWYKNQALQVMTQRVNWYASKMGLSFKQVKIMDARTRWGSCGPKGTLNFSWRLVMAPMKAIDYVVIHELIHLQEKNHSKSFWVKMKILMPDYQKMIEWLEMNGNAYNL